MASSKSLVMTSMSGVRVAADPIYYPANIGKKGPVSQKITFTVYANSKQRNGTEVKDRYDIVAWGKLADTLCHALHAGKELNLECIPGTYKKRLFNQDGTQRLDAAGQPVEVLHTNYTISRMSFGSDGAKFIEQEIQAGVRPPFWNVPWSEDYKLYQDILKNKVRNGWDGRSNKLGNADVRIPQGMNVDFSQYNGAGAGQPMPSMPGTQDGTAALLAMVQQLLSSGGNGTTVVPQQPKMPVPPVRGEQSVAY